MAFTPTWTYGMVLPSGDNTESEPFNAFQPEEDDPYLHEVPDAVGDGKDQYGFGGIIAGMVKNITTTTTEVED